MGALYGLQSLCQLVEGSPVLDWVDKKTINFNWLIKIELQMPSEGGFPARSPAGSIAIRGRFWCAI